MTGKEKISRQEKKSHWKRKTLTPKEKVSRQGKSLLEKERVSGQKKILRGEQKSLTPREIVSFQKNISENKTTKKLKTKMIYKPIFKIISCSYKLF